MIVTKLELEDTINFTELQLFRLEQAGYSHLSGKYLHHVNKLFELKRSY